MKNPRKLNHELGFLLAVKCSLVIFNTLFERI